MASRLLPNSYDEFHKEEYWRRFFAERSEAFEWYGGYADVRTLWRASVEPDESVLVVGCGNSASSADMYDDGYHTVLNVDFSEPVVQQMRELNAAREGMLWEVMDMTALTLPEASVQAVFDKGALDALMSQDTEEVRASAARMFASIERVLAPGGRYFCMSMAQDFILRQLLAWFVTERRWLLRVHHSSSAGTEQLRPYVFVLTKPPLAPLPDGRSAVELWVDQRVALGCSAVAAQDDMQARVFEQQLYEHSQHQLAQVVPGRVRGFDLFGAGSNRQPRFKVSVVDRRNGPGGAGRCAVFLVPQGREHEWMFCTEEGMLQLSDSAGFERLVVVVLCRGHRFGAMDEVQAELSPKMAELAPAAVPGAAAERIPFVTVGEGIGSRDVVHQGLSELSGEFVVEDVPVDDKTVLRRLVFTRAQNVIQSEVKLVAGRPKRPKTKGAGNNKKGKGKGKGKKKGGGGGGGAGGAGASAEDPGALHFDHSFLSFDYHRAMAAGLSLAPTLLQERGARALVVGLGGGMLTAYLHDQARQLDVTAVELDPAVVEVATQFFGFAPGSRLRVHEGDGLEFVAAEQDPWQLIVIDVDAKDASVGMSCPPEAFVAPAFLARLRALLDPAGGLLVCNVSCRSPQLYARVVADVSAAFEGGSVLALQPTADDVNRVLFALPTARRRAPPRRAELQAVLPSLSDDSVDEYMGLVGRLERLV